MPHTINAALARPFGEDGAREARPSRFALLRRVIIFQVKLALDGLRDFIMSPLSIMAAVIGILFGGRDPEWAYRRLLAFGRRTDVWINLFDQFPPDDRPNREPTVDEMVDQMEDVLRRDFEEGGISARTAARLQDFLERARTCPRGRREP